MLTLRTIPKIRIRHFSIKRELELTNKMFNREVEFSKARDEFSKAKDEFSEARVEMLEKMYQKEREIVSF